MSALDWTRLGPEGTAFTGRVTAQATHEIKNCLAVIHENAGLAEDFIALAERRGEALDPEKIAKLASRIQENIERANGIVRDLNRFSHLPDTPVAQMDLAEEVAHACVLHRRPAALAQVGLSFACPEPVRLTSNPFLFHALVSRAILRALAAPGEDRAFVVTALPAEGGAQVLVSGADPAALAPLDPDEGESALLAALGASWAARQGEIAITLHNQSAADLA